jgi:hypothetical protein
MKAIWNRTTKRLSYVPEAVADTKPKSAPKLEPTVETVVAMPDLGTALLRAAPAVVVAESKAISPMLQRPKLLEAEGAPAPIVMTLPPEEPTVRMTQSQMEKIIATACKASVDAYIASQPTPARTAAAPRLLTPGEAAVLVPEKTSAEIDFLLNDSRVDVPSRTTAEIALLIQWGETEIQRDARIANDKQRYRNSRAGRAQPPSQQSAITHHDFSSSTTQWARGKPCSGQFYLRRGWLYRLEFIFR